MDNFETARLAAEHLIAHGHRRLAFVTASGLTMSRSDKITGFLSAAEKAGLKADAQVLDGKALSGYGDSEMADVGRQQALQIARDSRRPTGIVAVNDMLALGLMAGFREAGLSVPQDVSIVGIDGLFLSSLAYPALTTVQLPVSQMANTMVERLMSRLADPTIAPGEFIFQPELIARDSVATLAGTAPRTTGARKRA